MLVNRTRMGTALPCPYRLRLRISEWDAKYREVPEAAREPAPIVAELLPLLPRGAALDLACGAGRHAVLLAQQGCRVIAVDASSAALDITEQRAHEAGLRVQRKTNLNRAGSAVREGLVLVQADLESARLPEEAFDVILCIHYLQRSLFAQMERALRPGGMLVFETFVKPGFASTNPETRTKAHLEFGNGPHNPEFLLDPYELRDAFPGLRTLFCRELCAGKGIASLLARKP